ncbi:MAG: hypothetical protein NC112_08865 [Oxalobacter formigenes]|nr:hypothetical protein [Oxalobacter formigenes]
MIKPFGIVTVKKATAASQDKGSGQFRKRKEPSHAGRERKKSRAAKVQAKSGA